jgi:hypothetical protein
LGHVSQAWPLNCARSRTVPVAVDLARFLAFSSQRKEICAVNFGFVLSLVVVILAVLGVFIEIPLVSNYAFWFAIGAYILLAGSRI